jgi:hypothetical protein
MHGKTEAIRNRAAAALHRGRAGAQSRDQAHGVPEAAQASGNPIRRANLDRQARPMTFARISAALADAAAARLQPGRRLRFGREWL